MPSHLARLGVFPIINCGSMRSFYGNTVALPEVVEAMAEAAQTHVIMEELQEAVSLRLAELTGFEAGLVTCGSAAALFLAAVACTAGNDPEKMLGLPKSFGTKNAVLMPAAHRFIYDHAFRLAGLRIVEVHSLADAAGVLKTDSVAMICYLGMREKAGAMPFNELARLGRANGTPVVVDVASEFLHRPNKWQQHGADIVIYSCGKFMRGPQASGLLLGRQDLIGAAWRNSAPQQAAGRCMKVGKDQMLGAVIAVEQWFAEDRCNLELDRCFDYLGTIEKELKEEPLLKTAFHQTTEWSVPRLRVSWDDMPASPHANLLRASLLKGYPRVLICDFGMTSSSFLIDAFSLRRDDCHIVAKKIVEFFRSGAYNDRPGDQLLMLNDLAGTWAVAIDFSAGREMHKFIIENSANGLDAVHSGLLFDAPMVVKGTLDGLEFTSKVPFEGVHLYYRFTGRPVSHGLEGDVVMGAASATNSGPVAAAQFGTAHWRAKRVDLSG